MGRRLQRDRVHGAAVLLALGLLALLVHSGLPFTRQATVRARS